MVSEYLEVICWGMTRTDGYSDVGEGGGTAKQRRGLLWGSQTFGQILQRDDGIYSRGPT